MSKPRTAIVHYTAPPIIGGVEAVILAHAETFLRAGYPVTVVAGRGEAGGLPPGADLILIPELDSRHPEIMKLGQALEKGQVPAGFEPMVDLLVKRLAPALASFDNVIAHNVLSKRFNLPLTAALYRLLEAGDMGHLIAWNHDFDWASPRSREKVHAGYPWDLLRAYRPEITFVVVSRERRQIQAELLDRPPEEVHLIYNGVEPGMVLNLSDRGRDLVRRLDLFDAGLLLLMPVRVTRAKNIEYALEVVAALKAQGCRPKLILTGPPDPHDEGSMDYFHSLQARRRELGVEDEMRFVFESGPDGTEGFTVGPGVVGDLYRVSDLMFMPSHREGFAMPVLEAGLAGLPVICTAVPAAVEIGGDDVLIFDENEPPGDLARRIAARMEGDPVHRLRRRTRRDYTWRAIFQDKIEPLLQKRGAS
ncbi:MAG: glycosyltransferase family 4 protein [Anaerolineae bacterium]|jgi:glycosyltransferase involved in cell wall biosynthesis